MRVRTLIGTLASVALMEATPAAARDLAVTVYNQDLGVVRDTRAVELASGTSTLRFTDVAARIDPTSVRLAGPVSVLEQNYSYDLASADKILSRYLDRTIDVLAEEGRSYRGTLLAFDPQNLVLGGVEGGDDVTIVGRDGVHDIRFPALPGGLITKPTLIWQVTSPRSGDVDVTLSYMTGGLAWHAEYVAVVAEDEASMELSGWVSIENNSGAAYPNARLKLVAGDVHRAAKKGVPVQLTAAARMADSEVGFEERAFFEYHLYELERRTTIADSEVKQLALFEPATTAIEKRYELDVSRYGDKVQVLIEARNSTAVGLGMPLPAGKIRAMKADRDGQLELVGEDLIDHTPRDEQVQVRLGAAFDIKAERIVKDFRRLSDRVREETVEVKLRNHKQAAVEIIVVERIYGSWTILESSHPWEKKEAQRVEFTLGAPPDQETVLVYTYRTQ